MAAAPVGLDYGALRKPPSRLFRDYLQGRSNAGGFFAGAFNLADVEAAAERTLGMRRPRQKLAKALVSQQEGRARPLAARNAARLGEEQAVAVVTGQQPILFGGPLLVLYKALAAIRLAEELEAKRGAPVVPVFWVASDDHDFEELRTVDVLDGAGQRRTLRYEPARDPSGAPAWAVRFDEAIEGPLLALAEALPESPGRQELLDELRRCYRPGASLPGAFAELLGALLPSLVILEPSDPALRPLMTRVLRREIEEGSPSSRLGSLVGRALEEAGYHEQVPLREGFLNAFAIVDGQRRALLARGELLELRGTERQLAIPEALAWLEREPEAFSPGALLRPLVQDALLPTVAYVGGPAELAYHAQTGPSYAHFGIPRPVFVPRPGVTLLEAAQARALEALNLGLAELQEDPDTLLARLARDAHPELQSAFGHARDAIERELDRVEAALGALDPSLRAAADAAKGRALHQLEGLREKATRTLKKRDEERSTRLRRTREALFPCGEPQERRLAFVAALARHGARLSEELRERIDLWSRKHQVIAL